MVEQTKIFRWFVQVEVYFRCCFTSFWWFTRHRSDEFSFDFNRFWSRKRQKFDDETRKKEKKSETTFVLFWRFEKWFGRFIWINSIRKTFIESRRCFTLIFSFDNINFIEFEQLVFLDFRFLKRDFSFVKDAQVAKSVQESQQKKKGGLFDDLQDLLVDPSTGQKLSSTKRFSTTFFFRWNLIFLSVHLKTEMSIQRKSLWTICWFRRRFRLEGKFLRWIFKVFVHQLNIDQSNWNYRIPMV